MVWETSLLDADEGIRFRGFTIPELQQTLPTYSGKQDDEPNEQTSLRVRMLTLRSRLNPAAPIMYSTVTLYLDYPSIRPV